MLEACIAEKRRLILGSELRDLALDASSHRQAVAAVSSDELDAPRRQRRTCLLVGPVQHHEQRRLRDQLIAGEDSHFLGRQVDRAQRFAVAEGADQTLEHGLLSILLALLVEPLEALVEYG